MEVVIDGNTLTIEQVAAVARHAAKVTVSEEARANIQGSRDFLEKCVADDIAVYGVTTGIGEFARIRISPEQSAELSRRIVHSHSAGTGDPQPEDVARAAMPPRPALHANTTPVTRPPRRTTPQGGRS